MSQASVFFIDVKSLYFADELESLSVGSTGSSDFLAVDVSVDSENIASFSTALYNGLSTIPIGDILRAASRKNRSNPCYITVTATCDSASATMTARCIFCRWFSDDESVIFSNWLHSGSGQRITYSSALENLPFLSDPDAVTQSALIRLSFQDGTSSDYTFADLRNMAVDGLDVSPKAVAKFASGKGLSKEIVSYDLWIIRESSSGARTTGKPCSFKIVKDRIERVTYKFLNQKGAFEYIHAAGTLKASVSGGVTSFLSKGEEKELSSAAAPNWEQSSGFLAGLAGAAYPWMEFLLSHVRYVVTMTGQEIPIVVDDSDVDLAGGQVNEVVFSWHAGKRNLMATLSLFTS